MMRGATPLYLLLACSACATVGGLRVEPIDRGDATVRPEVWERLQQIH